MGIIKKTRKTESLLSAEKKVCKRFLSAAPELPEEIPAFALRYKGFKGAAFAAIWVVPRSFVFVPLSFLWQGWRLFLFSAVLPGNKTLFN